MEESIRQAYNPNIFKEIAAKFGVNDKTARLLDGFESFIYEVEVFSCPYILRVSHTGLRRTQNQVGAEIEFINYLAENGVPASRAVPSLRGNLIERAESENPDFVGVLFEKAKGGPPKRHHWTPEFLEQYGRIMGCMHRLARVYVPKDPLITRPHGMEDLEGFAEKFLQPEDAPVIEKWNALLDQLRALPCGPEDYGLIHQDLHGGNFFVDGNGMITIFDFDDCQYFWYAHDIAMALFYTLPHRCNAPEHLQHARLFMRHFMTGYRREHTISPRWLAEIPTFIKLREMDLYIAIHRSMDLSNLDKWCASFMDGRRESILAGTPYIDLDFSEFA